MKKTKRSVIIWGIAGILLSLCTLVTAVYAMNSTPALLADNAAVLDAARQTLDCARSGDYEALEQMLYGTPDLGENPEKAQTAESLIWFAFLESIQYQLPETCYISGSDLALDVHISCLDISAVTQSLQEVIPDLLTQAVTEAEDPEAVYDEEHNYRQEFVAEILYSATAQILSNQPQTTEHVITLQLVQSGGRWQVVPTESVLQFLSGFVAE